ncbi:MAG: DUF262 domain-containing protein [Chitinophagaceae bacterium]|nr:DUF262 domain-containing protein [Chitinophagaceae bacterium]
MINGTYTINSLFALGDVQQLVIPEVQRDYVWEEKNCNRLFQSIRHGFDTVKYGMPDYISAIPTRQQGWHWKETLYQNPAGEFWFYMLIVIATILESNS